MARKMLLLDIDAILNKQFNIDFKGYSPVEVDQFLDSVVRDYDSYEKMLSEVSDEAEHLKNENSALKSKVAELEAKEEGWKTTTVRSTTRSPAISHR